MKTTPASPGAEGAGAEGGGGEGPHPSSWPDGGHKGAKEDTDGENDDGDDDGQPGGGNKFEFTPKRIGSAW